MTHSLYTDRGLWHPSRGLYYLLFAAVVLMLVNLGVPELWTQEHRWADIASGMLFRHDYLHPYLQNSPYYDKPLLSNWLMLAAAWVLHGLTPFTLRLPSAVAGVLAVWATYRIASTEGQRHRGLIAGWMLLTCYYFIFWGRVANTDMLNLAGVLLAIGWYVKTRDNPRFFSFFIFFLLLALTALCKGLLGAILPILFILPDLLRRGRFRAYCRWSLLAALVIPVIVYLIPFTLSSVINPTHYPVDGLTVMIHENVTRYFEPFDHKGSVYTYFQYLPMYMFPWIFFFIPAFCAGVCRFNRMDWSARWYLLGFVLIFMFMTGSGSRRNYYTLPLVPFAVLVAADWVSRWQRPQRVATWVAIIFLVLNFLFFVVVRPVSFMGGGIPAFVSSVKTQATRIAAWSSWQLVFLDARSNLYFYFHASPLSPTYGITGQRDKQRVETLLKNFPVLCQQTGQQLFISREEYAPLLAQILQGYEVVHTPPDYGTEWTGHTDASDGIAFIPIPGKARCAISPS